MHCMALQQTAFAEGHTFGNCRIPRIHWVWLFGLMMDAFCSIDCLLAFWTLWGEQQGITSAWHDLAHGYNWDWLNQMHCIRSIHDYGLARLFG